MRPLFSYGSLLCGLLLNACAIQGPDNLQGSRLAYNSAIQQSEQRELLLNLVRLRHAEEPEFLAVSGISTQMQFEASMGTGAELSNELTLYSPGMQLRYSESPTITLTPQRDQEFTRQLLAPIAIDVMYLAHREGWRLSTVLQLVVEQLNQLPNPANASPSAQTPFATVSQALEHWQQQGALDIAVEQRLEPVSSELPRSSLGLSDHLAALEAGYQLHYNDRSDAFRIMRPVQHYFLDIHPEARSNASLQNLLVSLGLPQGLTEYEIDPTGERFSRPSPALRVRTRSVLGAMRYLAQSVPTDQPLEGSGSPPLLNITRSARQLPDASISVPYGGDWYSVHSKDRSSRETLSLMIALMRLNLSASGAQHVPVLTLPVAP